MRDWKKILGGLAMACLLAACQTDDWREARGGIRVSLGEASVGVETKSTPEDLGEPLTTEFNVRVVKEGGSEIYNGKFPDETIPASAGTYTVTASYGENAGIAWDAPYYEGTTEEPVVVKDGETATATVTCKVANALFSATFPPAEEMKKAYEAYGLKVTVGSTSMTFKPGETRHIYVKAGSAVKYAFAYTRLSGEEGEAPLTSDELPTAPAAGTHYTINLTMDDKLGLDISKVEAEEVSISETIPLEWLPAPKVNGFDGRNSVVYTETAAPISAVLAFSGSHTIQDVEFSFEFADAQNQFQALNEKTFKLSELSEEDRTLLNAASIILPTLDGTNKGQFDFTAMTGNLQTNAGAETVNKIKLRVQANNRWSSEGLVAYEIKTVAPKFKVDAYPGNIWTKEFTMNALREEQVESGDFNTLSSDMTYQFSANGSSNWENLGDDLKKGGLTPGTTYYIRGLYRGEVPGDVAEVELYEQFQIPNSSLDEGYTSTNPKRNNPLYIFNGNWIDTRNELTCHSDGANVFYVSKSSTLPINDNGSTVAHMMVIGWGAGNTCDFGKKRNSIINNISSGFVCVGDYDANSNVIKAKEAYIRPTSLTFTYKASPYNGDEYLVEATLLNITDGVETIIGEGKLQSGTSVGSYITQSLDITYNESAKELPISHVKVLFQAGTEEDRDHLEDEFRDFSGWETITAYASAYIIGSQFWLDSFKFNYDK